MHPRIGNAERRTEAVIFSEFRVFSLLRRGKRKKKLTLKFSLLYSLTLSSTLLGLDRQNYPSLHRPTFPHIVRHFLVLVSLSLSFLLLSTFPLLLYLPILSPTLYLLSLVQIRIHVHTRTHTCIHPLHFDSVLVTVYVLIFTIIIWSNI